METTTATMSAIDKEFLLKHGFTEDTDKKILLGFFTDNKKFKEANITIDITKPYMQLLRSTGKNVSVKIDTIQDTRLILKRGDRFKTVILNILIDEISNCMFKDYGNGLQEFIFEICGVEYSLNVK